MLRENRKLLERAHIFLDISLTVFAFINAYFIKKYLLPKPFQGLPTHPNYYEILFLCIIIWYLALNFFDITTSYRKQHVGQILWNMFRSVSGAMLILTLCIYLFKLKDISRIMMSLFFILDILLLGLSRSIIYWTLSHFRRKGLNSRNILIIGSREAAKDVIHVVRSRIESGYRILGCIEKDSREIGKAVTEDIRIIGTIEHIENILWDHVVDEIIVAMPIKEIKHIETHIAFAENIGVPVRILPQWELLKLSFGPHIASLQVQDFLGIPTMIMSTTPRDSQFLLIKNAFDYFFAAIAMTLFLPFFIIIALCIKISSEGPVFFEQRRVGLNGRIFMMKKFRTMRADAEKIKTELAAMNEADGPVFKIENDPRIIPYIGHFLRKTSLDELPQLINVIRGEMSLIGPRPPIPDEVAKYDVWQRRRLSMKPGITCLWQIMPRRNDLSFDDWMNLDMKYIDKWSLKLDAVIFFKTLWVMLTGAGR
jgi:exopolysaccharide biosynthesis polyprenyl glycosylphosphotransferase